MPLSIAIAYSFMQLIILYTYIGVLNDNDAVDTNDICETNSSSDESECEYDDEVEEYWDIDFDELCEDFNTNTSQPSITNDLPSDHSCNILKTILLFVQLWALFYNISAAAMNHLFQFLSYIFKAIAEISLSLSTLASIFPTSLYKVRKYLAFKDLFEKYVVCKKCNSIYHFKDCFECSSLGAKAKVFLIKTILELVEELHVDMNY